MPELAHPLRREPEQRADADELRERLRFQLAQLRELAGLDELPQPRLDPGPIPASSRTRPARTSASTSAGVDRISSAARRYARTV